MTFDFLEENVFPLALGAGAAVANAFGTSNNHDDGVRVSFLNERNRTDEGVTAAVRLDAAVHKRDELILITENGLLAYLDFDVAFVRCGLCMV